MYFFICGFWRSQELAACRDTSIERDVAGFEPETIDLKIVPEASA